MRGLRGENLGRIQGGARGGRAGSGDMLTRADSEAATVQSALCPNPAVSTQCLLRGRQVQWGRSCFYHSFTQQTAIDLHVGLNRPPLW